MTHDDEPERSVSEQEMLSEIDEGQATYEELDEKIEEKMRRDAAERDSTPDSTDVTTAAGFGSGQGMGTEETGQEPDRPDEEGFPRTERDKEDWPA